MDRPTRMADLFELPPDAEVGLYDLAPAYDFVYRRSFDYDRQAELVREAVGGEGVLELACGTGALAERLAGDREDAYVGLDASASMLAVASRNVEAAFVRGDARGVAFDRRFGAVAMLGRATTHFGREDLEAVAGVAREHLDDGEFVLDAHDRSAFVDGYTSEDRFEDDRWAVVYRGESTATGGGWCRQEYGLEVTDRRTDRSRTFEGSYEMRFWGADELDALLREAGFETVHVGTVDGDGEGDGGGYLRARASSA